MVLQPNKGYNYALCDYKYKTHTGKVSSFVRVFVLQGGNKIVKRFISFVMALGMAFMLWGVPIEVSAAESGDCGNSVTWTYDRDSDTLTISGNGAMADYTAFVSNRAPWYNYWTTIESIVIENGVTKIGNYAFHEARATNVTIPASVTAIGEHAFDYCDKLESITIPDSVETIGSYAFKKCIALKSIAIPNSVTTIGEGAFNNCSALESVTLSNSITSINQRTFSYCEALTDITIPESVESIGSSAFVNCIALTDITIPKNVKGIDGNAFWYCESLTSVTFEGTATIPTLGKNVFLNCKFVTDDIDGIKVPAGYESAYSTALGEYKTAIPHSLTQHTAVSPDCINNGSKEYWECSDCGMIFADAAGTTETTLGDFIPALGHSYSEDWSHDENEHWRECTVCGDETEKTAHTWDEGEVTQEATTSEDGVKTYTCTVCGAVQTEAIPAAGEPSQPQPPSRPQPPTHTPAPNTPAAATEKEENVPRIDGNNSKSGWQTISEEIAAARTGGTVTVDMNGTTELPKDIAEDIAGKDVDIVLNMGGGLSWTINGLTVTDPKAVDLSVSTGTKNIPVDVINYVSGENYTMQLSLAHSGDFGFTATLTVNLSEKNNGLYANLFHYDETLGEMDFSCCDKIENGNADLVFTHASEWAVVISEEPMYEDVSAAAGVYADEDTIVSGGAERTNYAVLLFIPLAAGIFTPFGKRKARK